MMLAVAEPSVGDQYAAAFHRRWPDIDIDRQEESAVVARLREERLRTNIAELTPHFGRVAQVRAARRRLTEVLVER